MVAESTRPGNLITFHFLDELLGEHVRRQTGNIVSGHDYQIGFGLLDQDVHHLKSFIVVRNIRPKLQIGKHQYFELLIARFNAFNAIDGKFVRSAPNLLSFFAVAGNAKRHCHDRYYQHHSKQNYYDHLFLLFCVCHNFPLFAINYNMIAP